MNLVNRHKNRAKIKNQYISIGTKLIITGTTSSTNLRIGDIVTVIRKESCKSEHCSHCESQYVLYFHCDRTNRIQHASCRYEFEIIEG